MLRRVGPRAALTRRRVAVDARASGGAQQQRRGDRRWMVTVAHVVPHDQQDPLPGNGRWRHVRVPTRPHEAGARGLEQDAHPLVLLAHGEQRRL